MEQLSLFSSSNQQFSQPLLIPTNQHAIEAVHGLRYIADYLTEAQHDWLLDRISKQQWEYYFQRRVQHYGQVCG